MSEVTLSNVGAGIFSQLKLGDPERERVGLMVYNAKGGETAVDDGLQVLPGRATVRLVKQK
eukprot:COSAG02_NODE_2141_length_9686_cov_3.045791_3_plen_61_part_00